MTFNVIADCRFGPTLYNRHDIYVGGSLAKYREFSIFEQHLFEQVVKPGHVVVEVGANIGAHTVQLARLAKEVHAFEPQRIVFQALCANVAIGQCANVFTYQLAVGSSAGSAMVPALPPDQRASFGSAEVKQHYAGGEPVKVISLDSLALPACDFLKIDVEGMEVAVLRGALETIAAHAPLIYVENDREDLSESLLEVIDALGYAAYWHFPPLFNPDNFAGDKENIFPGIVSVNMLCAPKAHRVDGLVKVASPSETWREGIARQREELC